jgi:hypothetical protein
VAPSADATSHCPDGVSDDVEDMTMAVKPPEDWAKAKEEYYALTGIKKPREKVALFFKTSHTGLSKAIQDIADFDDLKPKDKTLRKFEKLRADYESASKDYIKLLTKLIDDEDEKTITQGEFTGMKLELKKVKTDMYRGLKMLKAKLENYSTMYEVKSRILTDLEAELDKIERLEGQFEVLLKNGVKRFTAAAQAVKSTPTVEVWNREFGNQDGARSLTTALGAFRAIEKEADKTGLQLTDHQQHMLALTNHWIAQLSPWADGDRRTLSEGDDVLAELKAVSAVVKQCVAAVM